MWNYRLERIYDTELRGVLEFTVDIIVSQRAIAKASFHVNLELASKPLVQTDKLLCRINTIFLACCKL
jgi:hypothetical protein